MFTDHLSASRMIGMQELAQLQEPPTPKNTCLLLHIAMFPIGAHTWCHVLGVPDTNQLQAQIISRAMKLLRFCPITPAHRKPPWPGVQARPATLYQTAGCASIGRSVPAPGNPFCGVSQVSRLHGRLPLHSRAQCRLVCRYGMGDHPC